jgi:integrase
MARKSKGEVLERPWKRGRGYALRFWVKGQREYLTLGSERDGWTRERAEEALADILAEVRLGIWVRPKKRRREQSELEEDSEAPIFGPFARRLVATREGKISKRQHDYEEWGLKHLLPFFGDWPLAEIDIQAVDVYVHHKVEESDRRRRAIERRKPQRNARGRILKPLCPSSVNKTIDVLQWVLSVALEYKHIAENPAAGPRRRLTVPDKPPVHLDTAEQIEALLDAAAELDRDLTFKLSERQAVVATLVLAGPRAIELGHMLWRDVDLANGRLFVGRSKTKAGLREIKMLPVLRDVLAAHKAQTPRNGSDHLVFPTETGGWRDKDNLRNRVLLKVFDRANELLEEQGRVPLPKGLTAHKLRHTFASVLVACGEDPTSVMHQLGHTDPAFTLRVYTHLMSREPGERARLKALVNGERVVAVPPPGAAVRVLACTAYELPILRALHERGGSARRGEVRATVLSEVAGLLGELDREMLPSGEPRWEARFDKARSNLREQGYLGANSPRGVWEMAEAGIERLGERTGTVQRLAALSEHRRPVDSEAIAA